MESLKRKRKIYTLGDQEVHDIGYHSRFLSSRYNKKL